MLDPMRLHGIIPPMCTPLTEDGEIDGQSVHNLVDFLIENGVHGLFVLGSTGEFALLSDRQKQELIQISAEANRGRVPLLAGILDTSTRRCIEDGEMAKAAGADALVLASVYYYRISQPEILDHFRAVRREVNLPLLAYDVPTVNAKLEVATIETLLEEGVVVGIKDSSGVVEQFRRLLLATRDRDLRVFTGSELIVDLCLAMGAHGSVPGLGNVLPAEYVQIYRLARDGDWDGAARLQERLLACFWELIGQGESGFSASSSALGGFKSGLKARGVIATTRVGAPLHSFGPAEEERVADVLSRHGFL